MLQFLLQTPRATVSEVAEALKLPCSMASSYLRMMNARGILGAEREGRFVRYAVESDPMVRDSKPLANVLKHCLKNGTVRERNVVFQALTATTHPRRITILRVLADRPGCTEREISRRASIPRLALVRHLDKLLRRKFIMERAGRFYIAADLDELKRILVQCAVR